MVQNGVTHSILPTAACMTVCSCMAGIWVRLHAKPYPIDEEHVSVCSSERLLFLVFRSYNQCVSHANDQNDGEPRVETRDSYHFIAALY